MRIESDWERVSERRRIGGKKKRLDDVVCLQKQGRRFRTTPYRGKKKEAGRRRLRAETRKLSELVTVHRIGWSDRGPDGSMLFSHGTVPYLKRTVNLNGSGVSRSDRTVRSGFNNLDNTNEVTSSAGSM